MDLGLRSGLRILAFAGSALALLIVGILIGTRVGQRVVTVERRIIAPVIQDVQPSSNADLFTNLIQAACPAIVAIENSDVPALAKAPAPTLSTKRIGHRRHKPAAGVMSSPPQMAAGFIVSPSGYLITSAAALSETGTLYAHLSDGRVLTAERANIDEVSGLALLKVDATDLPTLEYADTGFPQLGQFAVLLAAPHGAGCIAQPAMISGDFIADGGNQRGYSRIFPAAGAGFAGAPVIGSGGRVIGVAGVAPRPPPPDDSSKLLPATAAASITTMLLRGSASTNPDGLVAVELDGNLAERLGNAQQGAVIMLVEEGSSAARAGLKAGDIVLAVDGAPISGTTELGRALDNDETDLPVDILRAAHRLHLVIHRKRGGK